MRENQMPKLTAILTASCLALTTAITLQAAKPEDAGAADKPAAAKPKSAAPKQHQQPAAPKTDHTSGPKKPERTAPDLDAPKAPKIKPEKTTTDKSESTTTKKTAPGADPAAATTNSKKGPLTPEAVKKIQAQHTSFKAKPSSTIASATFNPNYRIEAASNWDGAPYEIYRSYQPQWHDQAWYHSRYNNNLVLIGGGWYFWEAGYWFPAWGYDESAAYYPYDGPIYVGQNPRPFDQVVADVQTVLQEQGLYRGEIDGLIGPQTREALTAYQSANGLPPTAALDQPTLESLGLSV